MQKASRGHKKSHVVVFVPRLAGIPKKSNARFWRGERAETIVEERRTRLAAEKEAKRSSRKSRRRSGAPGKPRVKTPNQQLSRLKRQLARRKTLAARQRLEARIKELQRSITHA